MIRSITDKRAVVKTQSVSTAFLLTMVLDGE